MTERNNNIGCLSLLAVLGITIGTCTYQRSQQYMDSVLVGQYPDLTSVKLQSSYGGRITELFTTSPVPDEKEKEYVAVANFFEVPLYVLTDDKDFQSSGNIHIVPISHVYHEWLRDLFLVGDNQLLVNPYISKTGPIISKYTDQVRNSLEAIAIYERISPVVTPFMFEGGQALQSAQYTIAPDFWNDSRSFYTREEHPQSWYTHAFGNPMIFVRTMNNQEQSIIPHLDIFVTVVDDSTAFVGDVSLGNPALKSLSSSELYSLQTKMSPHFEIAHEDLQSVYPLEDNEF
ncbi:MAG: hypothetical protein WC254_06190, partial [Candidatus Woesearchaeota archaeon]